MSVAGRFEILSPVFSGAVETSTARDTQTGDTVLLHVLPADRTGSPEEIFHELAPACPGKILAAGVDAGRRFVVTDYPRDRKALLLWIRQLSGLATPPKAAGHKPAPTPPAAAGATRMFDPAALFGGAAAKPDVPAAPPEADRGATRMFDPAALFQGAASPAQPAESAAPPPASAPAPAATRMFDPAAAFGAAAAKREEPSPPSTEGATRMFDPAALFGSPDAKRKETPAPPENATRMFDPGAVFSRQADWRSTGTDDAAPSQESGQDRKPETPQKPPHPRDQHR